MLFKALDMLVSQRTQLINALRGHFGEIGNFVPKGPQEVAALVAMVMNEKLGNELPSALLGAMRAALRPKFRLLTRRIVSPVVSDPVLTENTYNEPATADPCHLTTCRR